MQPLRNHITTLLIALFCGVQAFAQTHTNEWVEYGKVYYKISVHREGIYRVPYSTLSAMQGVNLSGVDGQDINIFSMGNIVPFYFNDANQNNLFDNAGDFIEFYGKPNDGSFDTNLYADANYQPNSAVSLFNDTAIYFLTWNTAKDPVHISNITNNLTNLPAKEEFYMKTVRRNGETEPISGRPNSNLAVYESVFDDGEGITMGRFNSATTAPGVLTLATPDAFTTGPATATLNFNVISMNNVQHNLTYRFNQITLANEQFNGFRTNRRTYTIPLTSVANSNGFTVQATASSSDNNAIAYVEIIYPSQFKFQNSGRASFTLSAGTGPRYIEMVDFNDRGTSPILYDLTNNQRIVGAPGAVIKFRLPTQPADVKRSIFVSTQHASDLNTVTSLQPVTFSNFFNEDLQGNYIILSHPQFIDGVDRYPDKYAKYRESIAGGSNTVTVVPINQLYDQFAYGIKKHPLAIRNFIDFALDKWTTKPDHLFLMGKGREYWQQENSSFRMVKNYGPIHTQCLVPTFGVPGSDALLTATRTSITPRVAVGRLSVENAADINHYLNKVIAYERLQREAGDPYQTIAGKAPMKRIMHMSGGASSAEQTAFAYYLEKYETTIEDTLFGGDVYTFKKTSSAPIQIVQSDFIRQLINTGVSLITFFGHSSANSFDFSIDDPDDFNNFERYPIILSNGCYTGNIYNPAPGISEDFVLTPDKAAIAFISTIGLSASTGLYYFSQSFYDNMGWKNYGSTLGQIMQESIRDIETQRAGDVIAKTTAEEMTLHGDPGLRVNPHAKPDYALEAQNVSFIPNAVTTGMDSFEVRIAIVNLGRAIYDSMDVSVVRTFPGAAGGSLSYVQRIRATYFADTVYFKIPVGSSSALGLNQFRIKVENANEIDELSETNNELGGLTLNVTSDDVIPIYPYEFAIVPQQGVTLKASTANPFAPVRTYRMEIDTTELFNSPLLRFDTITQAGGVLKWTPPVNYMDSVVYYWRVGVDGENEYRYSSFIYLANEYPGWNQSHYYQYQKDGYNYMALDNDRIFKYAGDMKVVNVRTTGKLPNPNLTWDQMGYSLNATTKHVWNCGEQGFDNGIVIAVFDSASGNNWISKLSDRRTGDPVTGFKYNIVHKNQHCKDRDFEGFDFPTYHSDPNKTILLQQRIVDFINSVPSGDYILIYSINEARYSVWSNTLVQLIQGLGSVELNTGSLVQAQNNSIPWAFFVQKGNLASATEMRMNSSTAVLNMSVTFNARWNQGTITTPLIGPAFEWGSMHWKYHAMEPQTDDLQSIDIIGVTANGAEMVIDTGVTDLDYSIQSINATTYPYIRLRLDTRDDTTRTPTQLDYWRILYKKVPEAALNPAFNFAFRDHISLGEAIDLTMAVENVTEIPMDSLLVKYTLISSGNTPVNEYIRHDSLRAFETWDLKWLFNTNCNCLGDINTLQVEINPMPQNSTTGSYDQPEQYHFNNIATLQLKLDQDRINPLLDVTFDGVHIIDGDIVSAEPEIVIRLQDENKYLLLNDTSLINVFLIDPNNVQTKLRYDNISMFFTKASTGSSNRAFVTLKKFYEMDGEYTLLVQAEDRSRNISGTYGLPAQGIDYRISFKVIHQAMITNVLNYPNPFTSSTRFVFTLTGVKPPDFFKIQIMTVSGKVVRELTQADLGQLKIGKNITDYAWDGTDEYGDPLANGLYLYRVVASIDGQHIQKWDSEVANRPDKSTDKYFKSGFGKMYLAR